MINKEVALRLSVGQTLYHKKEKNADGTPLRCRVNGRAKTWVTRPADFRVPVVYGLRDYFYIVPANAKWWCTDENNCNQ